MSIKDRKNLGRVSVLGLFVSFLSTTFSQSEDMGFFLSVSGFVSKGYKLYAETFEIKDPLFLYSNAIALKTFGLAGPFYFDFLVTASLLPISFLIALKLTNSTYLSLFSAFIFQLTATGQFGQSLRSQVLGILFILVSVYFALQRKWKLAGVFASAVLFSKMPLLAVIGLILFTLVLKNRSLRVVFEIIYGFVTFSALILAILYLRGELFPYIDMIVENFAYASNYQSIVGQREGILGHYQVWDGSELRFRTFFLSLLLIIWIAVKNKLISSDFFLLAMSINLGVAIFLLNTAMWPHHLQVISLYVFLNTLFILNSLRMQVAPSGAKLGSGQSVKSMKPADLGKVIFPGVIVSLLLSNSGAGIKPMPETSIQNWFNPVWTKPVEIEMLEKVSLEIPGGFQFSRLGMNDDMGFGAFVKSDWRFVCKRHAIIGSEPIGQMNGFLDCLAKVPDVILIAPFYENQSSRPGNYKYYYTKSQEILSKSFACTSYANGYKYCLKKSTQ